MKIYYAGVPAGDGKLDFRERELYKFLSQRLLSYFYILINKEMWSSAKEMKLENK